MGAKIEVWTYDSERFSDTGLQDPWVLLLQTDSRWQALLTALAARRAHGVVRIEWR